MTEISSDEQSFKQAAPLYQQALDKCGYKHKLTFKHPSIQTNNKDSRRRKETSHGTTHHLVKMLQQTLAKAF